jgi:hypothetical protein
VVDAERAQVLDLLVGASGAIDDAAAALAELHEQSADAACGGLHETWSPGCNRTISSAQKYAVQPWVGSAAATPTSMSSGIGTTARASVTAWVA